MLCEDVIRNCGAYTDLLLSNIVLPIEALLCKDCECTNENHNNSLCQYYDNIVEAIKLAGVNTINTQHREDRMILTAQVGRNLRQICMTRLATFTFYGRTLGLHDKASF